MRVQILSPLKPFRQFFSHRLLDHSRPGKPNQRPRLSDMNITQHGKTRRHPARRRIGQHDDVRQPRLLHQPRRDNAPRHLHQTDRPLLHPRPARSRKNNQRSILQHRQPRRRQQTLTHRGPHGPAHEQELHRRDHRPLPADRTVCHQQRILDVRRLPRLLQPFRIAF